MSMIKGDQRKHAVQYVEWFLSWRRGSSAWGLICGLRNALNVNQITRITFPFKRHTFLFFNMLWLSFSFHFRDISYTGLKNCMTICRFLILNKANIAFILTVTSSVVDHCQQVFQYKY